MNAAKQAIAKIMVKAETVLNFIPRTGFLVTSIGES
jgi:hypothetical protein